MGGYGDGYETGVEIGGRLVIEKVAKVNGKDVSMIVRVCKAIANNADYHCSEDYVAYEPNERRKGDNTNLEGETVYINVKAGTKAQLKVSFEDSNGNQVSMPAFYLTILDLDGPSKLENEAVTVRGFSKLILPETRDYIVSEPQAGGARTITATEVGAGCDNPRNPATLAMVECGGRTVNQRARTFSALFENTFTYELTLSAEDVEGSGGRNFALAGWSALVEPCPTPAPTPPTPPPPAPPTCTCQASNKFASEVCSDKELFVWQGNLKTPHPVVGNWYSQDAEEFASGSCMAYVRTEGGTCAEYCEDQGLVCTRGMDDAHWQSNWLFGNDGTRCSIYPGGHSRQSLGDAGCNQRWHTQFCTCGCKDPSRVFLDTQACAVSTETEGSTEAGGSTAAEDSMFKACNVGFSNPEDSSDTTRDAVDMVFKSGECVKFGADDGGYLLVSTVGCVGDEYIHPSYEASDGSEKELAFPQDFTFQVRINGVMLVDSNEPTSFSLPMGENFQIEILATTNIVTKAS